MHGVLLANIPARPAKITTHLRVYHVQMEPFILHLITAAPYVMAAILVKLQLPLAHLAILDLYYQVAAVHQAVLLIVKLALLPTDVSSAITDILLMLQDFVTHV